MKEKKKKRLTVLVVFLLAAVILAAVLSIKWSENTDAAESMPPEESASLSESRPADIWDDESDYGGFTTLEQLDPDGDSIGVLRIEKIGLSCHAYDSTPDTVMEDMKRGVAHYNTTSYWSGNIGLAAHNGNASYSYFDKLHELVVGDIITYETTFGIRSYAVQTIVDISDDDWSYLGRTEDNRITLTTCITGQPEMRLCVQAVEISV